jgi:hypothetical protein
MKGRAIKEERRSTDAKWRHEMRKARARAEVRFTAFAGSVLSGSKRVVAPEK